jgi:hypothetical protein
MNRRLIQSKCSDSNNPLLPRFICHSNDILNYCMFYATPASRMAAPTQPRHLVLPGRRHGVQCPAAPRSSSHQYFRHALLVFPFLSHLASHKLDSNRHLHMISFSSLLDTPSPVRPQRTSRSHLFSIVCLITCRVDTSPVGIS